MENTMNMETISRLPLTLSQEIKSAVKTVHLAHRVSGKMEDGATVEEVVGSYLPLTDPQKLHEDMENLKNGVNSVYTSLDETVDEQWVSQHLNHAMTDLNNRDRVKYLANIIEMAPAGSLDRESMDKVEAIQDAGEFTDEDVAFLVKVTQEVLSGHAGALKRSSVMAMDHSMHLLPKDAVKELMNAGADTALAYGAAYYVLAQCGETPWGADGGMVEKLPYCMGATAAANIEGSRLMALYYAGKIRLTVLTEKLKSLYETVITFVCEHTMHAVAMGMQAASGVVILPIVLNFLYYTLHFGPWVAIIGSAALTLFAVTKLVTTQDYVDMLNSAWNFVERAWAACKSAWRVLLHKDVNVDADVDVEDMVDEVEKATEDMVDEVGAEIDDMVGEPDVTVDEVDEIDEDETEDAEEEVGEEAEDESEDDEEDDESEDDDNEEEENEDDDDEDDTYE